MEIVSIGTCAAVTCTRSDTRGSLATRLRLSTVTVVVGCEGCSSLAFMVAAGAPAGGTFGVIEADHGVSSSTCMPTDSVANPPS